MNLKRRIEKLENREAPDGEENHNRSREFWEELWDRLEAQTETGEPFDLRELTAKYGLDWPHDDEIEPTQ